MKSVVKSLSSIILSGSLAFASSTIAQDEAAPVEPAGPDPRDVVAENIQQLLDFVRQGQVTEALYLIQISEPTRPY